MLVLKGGLMDAEWINPHDNLLYNMALLVFSAQIHWEHRSIAAELLKSSGQCTVHSFTVS